MKCELRLHTLDGCSLAIGRFPPFRYDSRGGGGVGLLELGDPEGIDLEPIHPETSDGAALQLLHFPPEQLSIPALDCRTCRFLGLPLPPGLAIRIEPVRLEGWLHPAQGSLRLRFQARFHFQIGRLYRPPHLWVDTWLCTGSRCGAPHPRWGALEGRSLFDPQGGLLVGVAPIPPSGDPWLDRFLGLPGEAMARLRCALSAADGVAGTGVEPAEQGIHLDHRGIHA
ncbi:MAG: hypothetical protein VKM34_06320 [Cyanobacteriota bacterium]|nr:hypothetical protein [Cyanobacteriota bacterium]